ncbi:hypothetical protein OHB26_05810 [Nocardia sp. NBC_01503]|uniref:hypothetical protein n=1 Tax=Nocardia sp. NBC_01503 TaxID=2975997 RepID=UPI002E7AEAD2|nr:hypothetical protein [Nocardia sp. NBC_01503]WTL33739.1 hypothetical protein OHB26_05810 [Nocardia sp. NBC_01503]
MSDEVITKIRRVGRGRLAAALIAAMLVPTAGCTSKATESDAPTLTESSARQRIESYLTATLNALPRGVRLTLTPDRLAEGRSADQLIQPMTAAPCDGDLNDTAGPVKTQVVYYVSGIPSGQAGQYLIAVRKYWADQRWNVTETELTVQSIAATSDGYQLIVRHGNATDGVGTDVLIIGGTSPCYSRTAAGTTAPLPTVIEQQ